MAPREERRRRFGFFMRLIHFLLITISILLGAFLAAGYVFGEDMPYVGWYYEFPMFIFGGASLLLTILFAATRLRLLPIIPLAETVFCVFMMQPRFNSFKTIPENAQVFTVMTYNIMHAGDNIEEIKKAITAVSPDILFLQEFKGADSDAKRFRDEIFPDGEYSVKSHGAIFSKYRHKKSMVEVIRVQYCIAFDRIGLLLLLSNPAFVINDISEVDMIKGHLMFT